MAAAKTSGRAVTLIELAGWGGAVGMTYAIHLRGPMTVSQDETLGLLVATCTGVVETDEWVATPLGGRSRSVPDPRRGPGYTKTVWELPAKTEIRFAASHVRVMA